VIVDARRARRQEAETIGEPLDTVVLACRANGVETSATIRAATLDEWFATSGLAEHGDDGRLRLTREAWSLAGRAFG